MPKEKELVRLRPTTLHSVNQRTNLFYFVDVARSTLKSSLREAGTLSNNKGAIISRNYGTARMTEIIFFSDIRLSDQRIFQPFKEAQLCAPGDREFRILRPSYHPTGLPPASTPPRLHSSRGKINIEYLQNIPTGRRRPACN